MFVCIGKYLGYEVFVVDLVLECWVMVECYGIVILDFMDGVVE